MIARGAVSAQRRVGDANRAARRRAYAEIRLREIAPGLTETELIERARALGIGANDIGRVLST